MFRKKEEPVSTEIVSGKRYTNSELQAIADQILRDDTKAELCRECGEYGVSTGSVSPISQRAEDANGNTLVIDFPEYECVSGHHWYQGEGTARGIGGENPILFEEHFQQRRRREIYTTVGTPDPSIASGMYNRTHPQGRKVNSEEQRKRNGAAFFR